jgi:hypothetical protein
MLIDLEFLNKRGTNMETLKNVSNGRRSERVSNPKRDNTRLNKFFEISLLDHQGKIVNVSASGVYFEVRTNDTKAFPIGTTIPLQINAGTHSFDGVDENFLISGRGKVIRTCIIENPDNVNSLGVALEFTGTLETKFDND